MYAVSTIDAHGEYAGMLGYGGRWNSERTGSRLDCQRLRSRQPQVQHEGRCSVKKERNGQRVRLPTVVPRCGNYGGQGSRVDEWEYDCGFAELQAQLWSAVCQHRFHFLGTRSRNHTTKRGRRDRNRIGGPAFRLRPRASTRHVAQGYGVVDLKCATPMVSVLFV